MASYFLDENLLTYTLLILTKKMFIFGFFNEEQDIHQILDPLKRFLNSTNDVSTEKDKKSTRSLINNKKT